MPINFPNSPGLNDLYSYDNKTWEWNGIYWEVYSALTSYITSAYTAGDGVSDISGVTNGNLVLKSFSGVGLTITDSGDKLTFISSGSYLPTSGGTVTGNTIFTSGLTATTLTVQSGATIGSSSFGLGLVTSFDGTYINLTRQGVTTFIGSGSAGNAGIGTLGNVAFTLFTNNSAKAQITAGGNFLIGTTTDSGFKIDVNGVARVSGDITLGGSIRTPNATNLNMIVGNFALQLSSTNPQNTSGSLITTGDITRTDSGTKNIINVNNLVSSTSASFNILNGYAFTSNITQTQGTIRGLFIAPTLVASTNFRAIETTVGTVVLNSTSGNTLIGKTTDSGQKLQVSGNTLLQGSLTATTKTTIGSESDISCALLQMASTTQGVLFPRMTNTQRTSISSPVAGLMVYCTDSPEGLFIYKSTGWVQII